MKYKHLKLIDISDKNKNKIKNIKRNIKDNVILLKKHKDDNDCTLINKKITFILKENLNYMNIIDRLLSNDLNCCVCYDEQCNKNYFYMCEICNGIICINCLNGIYLNKNIYISIFI